MTHNISRINVDTEHLDKQLIAIGKTLELLTSFAKDMYQKAEYTYDMLEQIEARPLGAIFGGNLTFCKLDLLNKQKSFVDSALILNITDFKALILSSMYGYTRNRLLVDDHNTSLACSVTGYLLDSTLITVPKFVENNVYRLSAQQNGYYVVYSKDVYTISVNGVSRQKTGVTEFLNTTNANIIVEASSNFDIYYNRILNTQPIRLKLMHNGLATVYLWFYAPMKVKISTHSTETIVLTNNNNVAQCTLFLSDTDEIQITTRLLNDYDRIYENIVINARWQTNVE